ESDDTFNRISTGRGLMLLTELRRRMGEEKFDAMMDEFGRAHAGKAVKTSEFVKAAEQVGGSSGTAALFSAWLDGMELPKLKLESDVTSTHLPVSISPPSLKGCYSVSGSVKCLSGVAPASVDVTVETDDGETTKTFSFDKSGVAHFDVQSEQEPLRV